MSAPVIISAEFVPEDQRWLNALRERYFPPERNYIDAHLTLFHHLPPGEIEAIRHRLTAETRHCPAPPIAIAGVMNLGRGTAIAMACPELGAIRSRLADAFKGLLIPQDQAGWRPHVTIQNKVDPAIARALQASLASEIVRRRVALAGLATWYYRGGPWELISRHAFARH